MALIEVKRLYLEKKFQEGIMELERIMNGENDNISLIFYKILFLYRNKGFHEGFKYCKQILELEEKNHLIMTNEQKKWIKEKKIILRQRFTTFVPEQLRFRIDNKVECTPLKFSWLHEVGVCMSSQIFKQHLPALNFLDIKGAIFIANPDQPAPTIFQGTEIQNMVVYKKDKDTPLTNVQLDTINDFIENIIERGNQVVVYDVDDSIDVTFVGYSFFVRQGPSGITEKSIKSYYSPYAFVQLIKNKFNALRQDLPSSYLTAIDDYIKYSQKKYTDFIASKRNYNTFPTVKVIPQEELLTGEQDPINMVITEKLDGWQCNFYNDLVFAKYNPARQGDYEPIRKLYEKIKGNYEKYNIPKTYIIFGEAMLKVKQIAYSALDSIYYVFDVFDTINKYWLSWDDVVDVATKLGLKTVPVVFKGRITPYELLSNLTNFMDKPSVYSTVSCPCPKEGVILRHMEEKKTYNIYYRTEIYKVISHDFESKHFYNIVDCPIDQHIIENNKEDSYDITDYPKFLMVVGSRCSGKTSFVTNLAKSNKRWKVFDFQGYSTEQEHLFKTAVIDPNASIITDFNIFTDKGREEYLNKVGAFYKSVLVYFDFPQEECMARAKMIGKSKEYLDSFSIYEKSFQKPLPAEKFQHKYVVRNVLEANRLLEKWGAKKLEFNEIELIPESSDDESTDNSISNESYEVKPPKINHLFDLRDIYLSSKSSIPEDEQLIDPNEQIDFISKDVTVEEFTDGKYFWIAKNDHDKIVCSDDEQLRIWINNHGKFNDLDSKYVLWGIWVDDVRPIWHNFFVIGFRDKETNTFCSRQETYRMAREMELCTLPKMDHGRYTHFPEYCRLKGNSSLFNDKSKVKKILVFRDKEFSGSMAQINFE